MRSRLQGFGQVTPGPMNDLMPAPLPQEALRNIVYLTIAGNVSDSR